MRLAILAAALTLVALPAAAAERIDGTWEGNYECAQGKTRLTLVLDGDANGDVTGEFRFWSDSGSGSFRLTGTITSDGDLKLNPTTWISRPDGWETVGLTGRAYNRSSEGKPDVLWGDVTNSRCGKFVAERK